MRLIVELASKEDLAKYKGTLKARPCSPRRRP